MATLSASDVARELQRRLGPAWARVVAWLREHNALGMVEDRIRRGDYEGALGGIEDAAAWFATEVGAAQNYAAKHATEWLDRQLGSWRFVSFDEVNERAVRAMQRARVQLAGNVTADQRRTVRQVIADGVARGDNPREVARELRWAIGLTDAQYDYVSNFRRELESGQWAAARGRELIDGRWDKTFARLQRDGGSLTQAQVDTMVNRYSDNWVSFRAETIARTEGLRAAHVGHHAAFQQSVDRGVIAADDLIREWRHGPKRTHARPGHVRMHGQQRPMGVPFDNPDTNAQLMHPGDPAAGVEETANCMCIETIRYVRNRASLVP